MGAMVRSGVRWWLVVVTLLALLAGVAAKAPRSTTTTAPAPTTTTTPRVSEIARPDGVTEEGYRWYVHPSGAGPHVLLAVRRSATAARHPAIMLVDTSGGFNRDYLAFADELVAHGFDAAVGCLYTATTDNDPEQRRVPCADAPAFDGVIDSMVTQLDGLVDATYGALGRSTPLAVMGFSRGASVISARASAWRPEPVVLASGRYEGWIGDASKPDGLVDIGDRVAGWRAPALILHGTSDAAVPFTQSQTLESALRRVGVDVESHYYEGAGHNLAGEPEVHDDFVNRVGAFVCARLTCPA
jgi:dienelactone hydrolase